MSSIKRLNNLERRKKSLLDELLGIRRMIPGSYNEVSLRCGKKNCWCYKDKALGHISKRVTWSEAGTSKMKTIPGDEIPWVKVMIQNYRAYKMVRRKLRAIEKEFNEILDEIENETIKNTRKEKEDLW